MSNPYVCTVSLVFTILLSVLCIDFTTCYRLLNINDTRELLAWDIVSVSLKSLFILLCIYKCYYLENKDHASGFIGDEGSDNSPLQNTLTSIITHSLIVLISLTKFFVSLGHWDCSALAIASCMMGLSAWVFDSNLISQKALFEIFNSITAVDTEIEDGTNVNFDCQKFVLDVIQSTPALLLNMAGGFILLIGIGQFCGTVMQQKEIIFILCIDSISIAISTVCLALDLPLRPFPAYKPSMTQTYIILHLVFANATVIWFSIFDSRADCNILLLFGFYLTHLATTGIVLNVSNAREYDPSEYQFEVLTTHRIFDSFIVVCIFAGPQVMIGNWFVSAIFKTLVEYLAQFRQNEQCLKDISQLGQSDQRARALYQSLNELNVFVQNLNPSGNIDQFDKGYLLIKAVSQVAQNNQLVNASNQLGLKTDCQEALSEFVRITDTCITILNSFNVVYCFPVLLTALIIIFHLPIVGQKRFILNCQAELRQKCNQIGESSLAKMLRWVLDMFPLVYVAGFFLYQQAITSNIYQSITIPVIIIILMCVSGLTFAASPKTSASNPGTGDFELENLRHEDDSPAATV